MMRVTPAILLLMSITLAACGDDATDIPDLPDLALTEPGVADAIRLTRKELADDPSRARWLAYGRVLHTHGFAGKSAEAFTEALDLSNDSTRFEPLYLLGWSLIDLDSDRTVAAWREAIGIRDTFPPIHLRIGRLLEERGELEAAKRHFTRARSLIGATKDKKNLSHALFGLGRLAMRAGRDAESMSLLKKALSANPQHREINAALAQIYERTGRRADAARASDAAGDLSKMTGMADAYILKIAEATASYQGLEKLGMSYFGVKQFDQAHLYLRRALDARPDGVNAMFNYGQVVANLGRIDEAIAMFRRVLEKDAENVGALQLLGSCLFRKGDWVGARKYLDAALEVKPDYVEALYNIAVVLRKRDRAATRTYLDRLFEVRPEHDGGRILSALVYGDARNFEAAAGELKRLLQRNPRHQKARQAIEVLKTMQRK